MVEEIGADFQFWNAVVPQLKHLCEEFDFGPSMTTLMLMRQDFAKSQGDSEAVQAAQPNSKLPAEQVEVLL